MTSEPRAHTDRNLVTLGVAVTREQGVNLETEFVTAGTEYTKGVRNRCMRGRLVIAHSDTRRRSLARKITYL